MHNSHASAPPSAGDMVGSFRLIDRPIKSHISISEHAAPNAAIFLCEPEMALPQLYRIPSHHQFDHNKNIILFLAYSRISSQRFSQDYRLKLRLFAVNLFHRRFVAVCVSFSVHSELTIRLNRRAWDPLRRRSTSTRSMLLDARSKAHHSHVGCASDVQRTVTIRCFCNARSVLIQYFMNK